jgi:hypothetical protein
MVDLSGTGWQLRSPRVTVPVTVPAVAHTALHAAGAIGDPWYGSNDAADSWVEWTNWTFTLDSFDVPGAPLGVGALAVLVCDGLDTVAEVVLNGGILGSSANMHTQVSSVRASGSARGFSSPRAPCGPSSNNLREWLAGCCALPVDIRQVAFVVANASSLLRATGNQLEIRFAAPIEYALAQQAAHSDE